MSIMPPDPDSKLDTPPRFVIVGDWLAEEVDRHTCGTGRDGYYGHHEPGCGLEPVLPLADLPRALLAEAAVQRIEELHATHVRRCLDCRQQIKCEWDNVRRALAGDV